MKEVNELHCEKEQNALDGDDTDEDAVQPAEGEEGPMLRVDSTKRLRFDSTYTAPPMWQTVFCQ